MSAGRPKGLRYAHTLRWTGVPRVAGVREAATATGRLGWGAVAQPGAGGRRSRRAEA